MNKVIGIGIVSILLIFGLGIVSSGISIYNNHTQLVTQIEARQQANTVIFDNMWKTINQTVQVSDKYKDGLKEVLVAYTTGRSKGNNNLIMDWTKEAVPSFDSSIYKQINNIIEGSRKDFTKNQEILIDLERQDKALLRPFPNNIYASILGLKTPEIKVVTSTKTEKTFEVGKEDDIKL